MKEGRPERLMTALREYLSTPIEALLRRHLTTRPEDAAVGLFLADAEAPLPRPQLAMTLALRNLGFQRVPGTQVALMMRPS
jgi:hypothetical protein